MRKISNCLITTLDCANNVVDVLLKELYTHKVKEPLIVGSAKQTKEEWMYDKLYLTIMSIYKIKENNV